jgi:hypothetical protein
MATRIPKAFAVSGDKTAVPENSSSTEVSFDLGWTSAYELSQGTAGARDIDRGQHNQLWNTITANIKEWQDQGSPAFQTDVEYPKWSITRYTDDLFYIATESGIPAGTLPTNATYFTAIDDFFNFSVSAYLNQAEISRYSDKKFWPTIANDVTDSDHDIVFGAGKILSSDGLTPIDFGGMTKQLDATWAAGTNAGGLFSGTIAADETYHCFLIVNGSDGSVDCGFDTDVNCANIPVGYTAYRRIGSIITDSSSNVIGFTQVGSLFELKNVSLDLSTSASNSTTRQTLAITAPSGADIVANIITLISDTGSANAWFASTEFNDEAATGLNSTNQVSSGSNISKVELSVPVDDSGEIAYRVEVANIDTIRVFVRSWIDERIA